MGRKMKDSGIDWIGEIPEDWKVIALKNICKEFYSGGTPTASNSNYYTEKDMGFPFINISDLTNNKYVYNVGKYITEEAAKSKTLKMINGQFVLMAMYASTGTVSMIKIESYISQAILAIRPGKKVKKKFLYYFLDSFKPYSEAHSRGTTQNNLNAEIIRNLKIAIPKTEEQLKVSRFLDKKTEQIENIKSTILQEIQTLENYKKSVITEAVTRGLDKNVEMKDSGIEWIGEIPKHWKLGKIKNLAQIFGRIGYRGYTQNDIVNEGEGAVSLSPSNMCNGQIVYNSNTYISWEKYNESPEIKVEIGDILMVKTGSSYGKVSIVKELEYKSTINPQLIILKTKISNYKYLFYWMNSKCFYYQVEMAVTGGTIPTMSQEKIKNFLIVMPKNKEQEQIIDYLDKKTRLIDEAIQGKQKQLEILEEYKKSLIYEYVTGKKEVGDAHCSFR